MENTAPQQPSSQIQESTQTNSAVQTDTQQVSPTPVTPSTGDAKKKTLFLIIIGFLLFLVGAGFSMLYFKDLQSTTTPATSIQSEISPTREPTPTVAAAQEDQLQKEVNAIPIPSDTSDLNAVQQDINSL